MNDHVEATQTDRNRAAAFVDKNFGPLAAGRVRGGQEDESDLVQAFAAHRTEAERAGPCGLVKEAINLAQNYRDMLAAHCANLGEPLEPDDASLVAEWQRGIVRIDTAIDAALANDQPAQSVPDAELRRLRDKWLDDFDTPSLDAKGVSLIAAMEDAIALALLSAQSEQPDEGLVEELAGRVPENGLVTIPDGLRLRILAALQGEGA